MYITFPVALLSSSKDARPADLPFVDTTFAFPDKSDSSSVQVEGLYDARITFECCGLSCSKYTVWAFIDVLHDTDPISDKDETDFPYGKPNIEEQTGPHEDPIASGALVDANCPIKDPRDYTLRVIHFHVQRVGKHWQNAVQLFEAPFEKHVRQSCGPRLHPLKFGADADLKTSIKMLLVFCHT